MAAFFRRAGVASDIVALSSRTRAELPPGGRLGIYGFGASAHVVAQVALAQGATVHVLTPLGKVRELALQPDGSAGSSRAVAVASGDAPQWCTGCDRYQLIDRRQRP